jgi:hypothetical protein
MSLDKAPTQCRAGGRIGQHAGGGRTRLQRPAKRRERLCSQRPDVQDAHTLHDVAGRPGAHDRRLALTHFERAHKAERLRQLGPDPSARLAPDLPSSLHSAGDPLAFLAKEAQVNWNPTGRFAPTSAQRRSLSITKRAKRRLGRRR